MTISRKKFEEMRKTFTHKLKNGDLITFRTNMPDVEVKSLPIFPNQHKFNDYFKIKGYQLEIEMIMKN